MCVVGLLLSDPDLPRSFESFSNFRDLARRPSLPRVITNKATSDLVRDVVLLGRRYNMETEAQLFLKHRMDSLSEFREIVRAHLEKQQRMNQLFGSDSTQSNNTFTRSCSCFVICWSSKSAFALPVLCAASASTPGAL